MVRIADCCLASVFSISKETGISSVICSGISVSGRFVSSDCEASSTMIITGAVFSAITPSFTASSPLVAQENRRREIMIMERKQQRFINSS